MQAKRFFSLTFVVALLVVGCGGSSSPSSSSTTPTTPTTPTQTNQAPVINSFNFSPSLGIAQLTQFSFNASASDADGDTVSYAWDVAGTAFTGSSGNITFSTGTDGTVRLTVSDGKGGSATDTRTFVAGTTSGTWSGTVDTSSCVGFAKPMTATLTQNLTTVTGTIGFPSGLCSFNGGSARTDPAEPGRIDANGNVSFRIKVPPFTDVTFRGLMDSSGRRMSGGLFGSGHNGTPVLLTKQ